MLLLIPLINAELSASIYRGLFSKEGSNLIRAFPGDQNMVDARLIKGKTKVLTSTKSKEARTVDPKMQISADEYRKIKRRRDKQKSRYEQGETSKDGATKP